ncbi:hypothetical protein DPMN_025867 [Dreissena polymorpha]|uniref:Uncharacterized protein n=1 Tax=Dreissena polymorpha TaxID=45954 RepID=A0A9D4RDQ4_DREPO|nr:hypothetical protein DPMN_025867 [Dreissena polymorpha]
MHNMGKQTTYLEMTEKICSTLLKACQKRNFMDSHGPDGGISYDPETAEFQITNGKKVRVARPVHSNGSSNNDKPQGNADKVTIETQPPAKSESTPEEHSHDHEEL